MKITNSIHALKHKFIIPVTPGKSLDRFVYSFIVFGDEITLIDSGVKGSEKIIYDYIRNMGRSIDEIGKLFISHGHPDHIGAANQIKKDTQCDVIAHEQEIVWIEDIEYQNQQRPVPGFFDLVDESVEIDYSIDDNEIFSITGGLSMRIIHTPGHSPGLLSFLFEEQEVLFTGDALPLKNDWPNYDNYKQLVESLQKIKSLRGYNMLISSWGEPVRGYDEILKVIGEGEEYLKRINEAVLKNYCKANIHYLDRCKATIEELGLSPVFINSIVNKAFLSHLLK